MKRFYGVFGALLRENRSQSGLTQSQLGERVGLGRTAVTNIENGNQAVALHQVYEFAGALGVSVEKLLPQLEWPEQSSKLDAVGTLVADEADQKLLRTITARKERGHVKGR